MMEPKDIAHTSKIMKLAIFNGLPYHFEMYGYILHYCNVNGHTLTIYSRDDTHNWIGFYTKLFPSLQWKSVNLFLREYTVYDFIIVTTDDDRGFPLQNANNVICIDHRFNVRRPSVDPFYHIATRPFAVNLRKWALPCYPIVQTVQDKIAHLKATDGVHIVVLGSMDYHINRINRLTSPSKITLHFVSRQVGKEKLSLLRNKFNIRVYENVPTHTMMDMLYKSQYMICDVHTNDDHTNGVSMSGSIPLAFSTLNQLIISDTNNSFFTFTSPKVFSLNSSETINLTETLNEDTLTNIYNERERLVSMFHTHMNEIVHTPRKAPAAGTASPVSPWTFRV